MMQTSAELEAKEQEKWQHGITQKNSGIFRQLLTNEFASEDQHRAAIDQRLNKFLRYAEKHIPHYRNKLRKGKDPFTGEFTDKWCAKLPVLTRQDLAMFCSDLQPKELPAGEAYWETSLASTVPNVYIENTESSAVATLFLLQREARWNRMRPEAKLGMLLNASQALMFRGPREEKVAESVSLSSWPSIGSICRTGPATCLSKPEDIEAQYEWLKNEAPDYLCSHTSSLGALSRRALERSDELRIEVIRVPSVQTTREDRELAQAAFGARVVEQYELGEFGIIASECAAGRMHVHVEHCLVSVVDEQNRPCMPGQSGRVLITGYNNYAMPLIRFEPGHLADVPTGPCPCGRMLPAIENLRATDAQAEINR